MGEKFWMVFGHGGGNPSVQHPTKEIAESEARRLVKCNPGRTFYVLEAVSKHEIAQVQSTNLS